MKRLPLFLAFIASVALFTGCSKDDDNNSGKANFQVRLTDAPGDYKAVHLDIVAVKVHVDQNANDNDNGWQDLNVNKGKYNLLDLTNGRDTVLGSANFPPGRLRQIRLVLGTNSTVTLKDGSVFPLETPSAYTAGLKVKIDADLKQDVTYVIILDFDANKSVKDQGGPGNQRFKLHPVIRAYAQAVAGGIDGTVTPAASTPWVHAITNAGTAQADTFSAIPAASGYFKIKGLAAGTYQVHFKPQTPFLDKVETVQVTNTDITHMGTVTIPQ